MKTAVQGDAQRRMIAPSLPLPIAAVDIGSNAIRLVLGELSPFHDIRVLQKIREPVRLGKDVFASGAIQPKTMARAIESFAKFQDILKKHDVRYSRAVATSALREAKNRDLFVAEVKSATGIAIDIIDGLEEARLIHSAVANRVNLDDKNVLLIDIGGGSVELTVSIEGRTLGTETFKLGTVRLLQMLSDKNLKEKHLKAFIQDQLAPAKSFVQKAAAGRTIEACIGTGGNFECMGKLRVALLNRNSIFSMTYHELAQLIEHLSSMTVKERIQHLRLRPDRADVVVPAALVAQAVMACAATEVLMIPYVGLRDGILADLGQRIVSKISF